MIIGEARKQLESIVQRIETVEEEKRALSDDVKGLYEQAKSHGFDTKALKRVIADRRMDPDERRDLEAMVADYHDALAFSNTPLGAAGDKLAKDIADGKLSIEINGETIGKSAVQ